MIYLFSVLSVCSVVKSFFARIVHIRAYIRRDMFFALRCCLRFRSFYDLNLFRASSLVLVFDFDVGRWMLNVEC